MMSIFKSILSIFFVISFIILIIYWNLIPPRFKILKSDNLVILQSKILNNFPNEDNRDYNIYIKNGVVKKIILSAHDFSDFKEYQILSKNVYVLPGLIDMHVHFPVNLLIGNQELFSLLYLKYGVTSVRDLGSFDGDIFNIRNNIKIGKFPGPRIYACGNIYDGNPKSFPTNFVINNVIALNDQINYLKDNQADCIKIYNLIEPKTIEALSIISNELNIPMIGHVPHTYEQIYSKIKDIQHFTGITDIENLKVQATDYTSNEMANVSERSINKYIEYTKKYQINHTPTLTNPFFRRCLSYPDECKDDTSLHHLPRFYSDFLWPKLWKSPIDTREKEITHQQQLKKMKQILLKLKQNNIYVFTGTDTFMPYTSPGYSLLRELEYLVESGYTEKEAFHSATLIPGAFLKDGKLGLIQEGNFADLLIFNKKPKSISQIQNYDLILTNGYHYSKEEINSFLKTYDDHFLKGFYPFFMNKIINLVKSIYVD